MVAASGDALEWAIALAKSPAERATLRQRALPQGMELLLQVAAGVSGDALAEAATQTGEDVSSIVEAARFYAREILFYQGSDAYRMLGLSRDASHDQIKAHHRFLQQWLHPDRHTSDWDAIFAARVNAAWNNLRNDDRRRAYDDTTLPMQVARPQGQSIAALWSLPRTDITPVADAGAKWRRRAPVLALFGVCGLLGLAVVRDQQNAAHQFDGKQENRVATSSAAEMVLKLPSHGDTEVKRTVKKAQHSKSVQRPSPKLSPDIAKLPVPLENSVDRPVSKSIATPAVSHPLEPVASATKAKALASVTMAGKPAITRPGVQVAASNPKPRVSPAAPASKARPVELPVALVTKVAPSVAAATRSEASEAKAEANSVTPLPSAKAASTPSAITVMRVQQVQKAGDRLVSFMSRPAAKLPPIWNSLTAQRGATQLRDDLHVDGPITIATPVWRVGDETAAMLADIVYPDGKRGRLSANLLWRGDRWLVSGLTLERDL